jgi:hypothetical protein
MRRDQTKGRIVEDVSVGQAEQARGTERSRKWRSNVRDGREQAADLLRATVACM